MADITDSPSESEQESGNRIEPRPSGRNPTDAHELAIDLLRRERDFITAVLDTAGALVVVLDRQGRLVHINRYSRQVTGYTCDEVRGQPFWDKFIVPEELAAVRNAFQEILSGHFPSQQENVWLTRDGSQRHITWSNTALLDTAGAVEYIIATGIDVTEQRQAEAACRESEALNRSIIDSSRDCIKLLDLDGRLKFMSEGGRHLLGIEDMACYLNVPYDSFWEGSDRHATLEALASARSGEMGHFRGYCPTEDGVPKWWDVVISPILDAEGRVEQLLAVSRDITKQREAEEALRESREKLKALAESLEREREILQRITQHTAAHLAYLDPEFNFVRVNATYAGGAGHCVEDLIGRNHFELFPNAENQAVFERVRDTGESIQFRAKPFEYPDQPERGVTYWDWTLAPAKGQDGQVQGLVLSLLDVTEIVRAEQALRQERDKVQRYLDIAGTIIVAIGSDETVTLINKKGCEILGYEEEDIVGSNWFDTFIPERERTRVRRTHGMVVTGEIAVVERFENTVLTRSGEERIISWHNAVVRDDAGSIIGALSSGEDVTESKKAEEALRESREKLKVLFDLLPIGLSILDEERHVVQDNAALHRILGLSKKDLEAGTHTSRTYLRSDGTPMSLQDFPTVRAFTEQWAARDQVGVVTESGAVIWTDVSAAPVPFPDWKVVAATTDITELKKTQEALRLANEELERRVAERTLKLVESNLHLEQEIGERRQVEEELRRSEEALEQRVEERTRDLATLLEISNAVALSKELEPLLSQTLELLVAVVQHDGAMVYRLEDDTLRALLHRGPLPEEEVRQLSMPVERPSLAHELLATQKPISIPDIRADTPPARALRQVSGERLDSLFGYIRSWLGLPLTVQGQVVGLLTLQRSEPLAFDEREVNLAQAFAGQLAVAVENARLHQQAQQLAAMEERQRLARELHDAVSQTLFSASLAAEVLPRLWEKNPEMGLQCLAEVRQLTRGALAEMRTLLLELRPAALAQTELAALLQQLAEAASSRARMAVAVHAEPHCPLPEAVQLALYRIVQEALNNIAKHAGAHQAVIALRCDAAVPGAGAGQPVTNVQVSITDDGRGFDPALIEQGTAGMGLSIMRERAVAVGADLDISSAIGSGTRITVLWPSGAR